MTELRAKVRRLGEMAARNSKDAVMLPQIQRALREAQVQLAGAEQHEQRATKAIHDREKLRKWTKF